jgi:phosphoserine aminotransferase
MTETGERVFNFSAGPAAIPLSVLQEAQRDLLCYPGAGASILEISHRSSFFTDIIEETEANLRRLLAVPESYSVLFLQGGARLQFSMVAANLLRDPLAGLYLLTGTWGKMAYEEARHEGAVRVIWSDEEAGFRRVPAADELRLEEPGSYLHLTSNETIQGVQFASLPDVGDTPLVCDASSDFLSRPLAVEDHGLIYACAQKNAGAAGLTIVIVRNDLIAEPHSNLASMLDYARHARAGSRLNTPPVFAIYLFMLITRWLEDDRGGLEAVAAANRRKAQTLYEMIDEDDYYSGHAEAASRSHMNVCFRLPNETLDAAFLAAAAERGLTSLKGHRSVGGIRASIYNAMPQEGVDALRDFMYEFKRSQG